MNDRRFLCILLLAVLAAPAPAQSVKLPATLSVPTPGLVVVVPESVDGDTVAWMSIDGGLQLIPSGLLRSDHTAVGFASAAGTYRVRAVTAKVVSGKAVVSAFSECVVTVGAPPVPPGPGPGPGPGPTPTDPLYAPLEAAYAAEVSTNKAAEAAGLAKVYSHGAAAFADSANVKTWGDVLTFMSSDAVTEGVTGKLHGVQNVIAAEVAKLIPAGAFLDTALADADRAAGKAFCNRVSGLLGQLK